MNDESELPRRRSLPRPGCRMAGDAPILDDPSVAAFASASAAPSASAIVVRSLVSRPGGSDPRVSARRCPCELLSVQRLACVQPRRQHHAPTARGGGLR